MALQPIRRKNSVQTVGRAAGWAVSAPPLLGLFLLVGIADVAVRDTPAEPAIVVLWLLASAVATVYAGRITLGDPPRFDHALATALRRTVTLLGIGVLVAIGAGIGLAIFLFPGVYVALRSSLAVPACVLDGEDAIDAVQRSWAVAYGNVWKLFGIALLLAVGVRLLFWPLEVVVTSPAVVPPDTAAVAVEALRYAVAILLWSLAATRVYAENRSEPTRPAATTGGDPDVIGDSAAAARRR